MARSLPLLALALMAASATRAAVRQAPPSPARLRAESAATPPGFVYVPGGPCRLGTADADGEEDAPARTVFVPSFYIGRCEVTHAEWKRFRPDHRIPPGAARLPVTNVSFEDTLAYCRFAGGRLPTEAEWEKAARGTDGRRYPWGDRFDPRRTNLRPAEGPAAPGCLAPHRRRRLEPVDAYPAGASPCGALNMAGNAWEWVSDLYEGNPSQRVIRGGAAGYRERSGRTYSRGVEGAGVT